jgi:YidC/Oxa1 family membrane protein insertase
MFTTLIVQPIFNLLVLIYALLPGHNFGLAIIVFAVVTRLVMWPLVKKQLHHAKAMRQLQPELKRIKKAAHGDKRKEQVMVMELYKERQVNPFSSLGIIIVQIPLFLGLYSGLRHLVNNPHNLIDFTYPALRNFGWLKEIAANVGRFDNTLFSVVDLGRPALGKAGTYWPAMVIVLASAIAQYLQSKQLMPVDKEARSLRKILRDAGSGKQADSGEMNAAMGRNMQFILPAFIFLFTVQLPSALPLYWLASGLVAFWQQSRILKQDETELEAIANKPSSKKDVRQIPEAEVIAQPAKTKKTKPVAKPKRRKKR